MSNIILTSEQGVVLGLIKRHKCVSALEMTYYTDLNVSQIEEAANFLLYKRLIIQSDNGTPKRFKPRVEKQRLTDLEDY